MRGTVRQAVGWVRRHLATGEEDVLAVSGYVIARSATVRYITALSIIAILSVGMHVIVNDATVQAQRYSTLGVMAAAQQTLSERIVRHAGDLVRGDETARPLLAAAAQEMRAAHEAIIDDMRNTALWSLLPPPKPTNADKALVGVIAKRVPAFFGTAERLAKIPFPTEEDAYFLSLRFMQAGEMMPLMIQARNSIARLSHESTEWLRMCRNFVLGAVLTILVFEAVLIFRPLVNRIRHRTELLVNLATRDSLTGVLNRREFFATAAREVTQARRLKKPLSVVILDIDHFKQVNDRYGHATGDAVLKRFSRIIHAHIRQTDIFARIGGEEFAVIIPTAELADAARIVEMMRVAVANDASAGLPRITVSIGVAQLAPHETLIEEPMVRADAALYRAKSEGRNRVVVAPEPQIAHPDTPRPPETSVLPA